MNSTTLNRGAVVFGLFFLLSVAGCTDSHDIDGGVDVVDTSVDRPVDAFVCPDDDGDGFQSVTCGGDDCDDTDAAITPSYSECTGLTRARSCEGGVVEDRPCPPEAAVCDVRTGRCQASACGDGVLHAGEECDDGNTEDGDVCSSTCTDLPCTGGTQCPEARPSCSDRREDGSVFCMALRETGEPFGSPCFEDDDCNTDWCDLEQGRCNAACSSREDCGPGSTLCLGSVGRFHRGSCGFMCRQPTDCPEGSACIRDITWDEPIGTNVITYCVWSLGDKGIGDGCSSDLHCRSNHCHGSRCSTVCAEDSDCSYEGAHGPVCHSNGFAPEAWPVERFGGCIPERRSE